VVRFGVCQWSLDRGGPDALARAAELGFTAIHLDGDELGSADGRTDHVMASYADAAADKGVAIVAIAPGRLNQLGLTSPEGSERALACERSIAMAIHGAARLGAALVYLPSFGNGEILDEPGLRQTAQAIQQACDMAVVFGLAVATENTLSAADNLRLLGLVDRPNARVLLDTQNPSLWGHDVAAYVDVLWPHLADQVHVKDGRGGSMGDAVLGTGEAGFAETAAALRRHGFDGTLISENDYSGPTDGIAARDLAVLTRLFGVGA
jgi:2-epi-5-epi-valiolone 7-phosphate 2-epimerase